MEQCAPGGETLCFERTSGPILQGVGLLEITNTSMLEQSVKRTFYIFNIGDRRFWSLDISLLILKTLTWDCNP